MAPEGTSIALLDSRQMETAPTDIICSTIMRLCSTAEKMTNACVLKKNIHRNFCTASRKKTVKKKKKTGKNIGVAACSVLAGAAAYGDFLNFEEGLSSGRFLCAYHALLLMRASTSATMELKVIRENPPCDSRSYSTCLPISCAV